MSWEEGKRQLEENNIPKLRRNFIQVGIVFFGSGQRTSKNSKAPGQWLPPSQDVKISMKDQENNNDQDKNPESSLIPKGEQKPSSLNFLDQEENWEKDELEEKREFTDLVLGQITLIIMSGEDVNQGYHFTFLRSRPILYLGSDAEKCGKHRILLKEEGISPCHATIRWQEGKFILQDEGSETGTFFEGEKLIANTSVELKQKCSIRIGSLLMQYRLEFRTSPLTMKISEAQEKEIQEKSLGEKQGIVIAEFKLTSLDAPHAAARHCEIVSNKPHFLLGRATQCDYQIEFKQKYVADEQAIIAYSPQDEIFTIRGLIPENPIFVNNQRVKELHRLNSGDMIRLGVASNAPKVRFAIEGEEEIEEKTIPLSELIPTLERSKTYKIGIGENCEIQLPKEIEIVGAIAQLKVPEKGDQLFISRIAETGLKISIQEAEVKANETRSLSLHQKLAIGTGFAILHDHKNFVLPRVPKEGFLSDFIPYPQRGNIYPIGSAPHCSIRIEEKGMPDTIGEISVPLEGEYFLVKKYSDVNIPFFVDQEAIPEGPRCEVRYGINQVFTIGDHIKIRNNHRSLPAFHVHGSWKGLFKAIFLLILLAGIGWGASVAIIKYWEPIKSYFSKLMEERKRQKTTKKIPEKKAFLVKIEDLKRDKSLLKALRGKNQIIQHLKGFFSKNMQKKIQEYKKEIPDKKFMQEFVEELNLILDEKSLHSPKIFGKVLLRQETQNLLLKSKLSKNDLRKFNKMLLEDSIPEIFKQKSMDRKKQSSKKLMQKYQKNVFYIIVLDKKTKTPISSGTGFLWVQNDAYDNPIYYLITCKHVIEPWKFQKHRIKRGKPVDEKGNRIPRNYYIAAWPYGYRALDKEKREYLIKNSFSSLPAPEKLGDIKVHRKGKDEYIKDPKSKYRKHGSKSDIAVLKLEPQLTKWPYPYQDWQVFLKDKLDVGEDIIVIGYPSGGGRFIKTDGMVQPASCMGKLTRDCTKEQFLEIDVNQNRGASGGPVINLQGQIIGLICFSDSDKKLVYAIHSANLKPLFDK